MESGFVQAIKKADLHSGSMKTVDIQGKKVLLVNVQGTVYAMGAICNHRGWDLSEGTVEGYDVICAGHGSIWDVRTGKARFVEKLPDEPIYEVREEQGYIYVKLR
jgi:nitrite reductase/ring-hydroxylating ferredoxin subunit